MFRGRIRSIHFIGIGGVGMSGIAEVLLDLGFRVTGSDLRESDTTRYLTSKGAHIAFGHAARNVEEADVVVYSSAVKAENPEITAARERGIPVIRRAEMLGELMRLKDGIAIAGSHGKTTTTSLVATVLREAGLDPTVIIGGRLNAIGSGAASGKGEFLVAEADESDGSFLRLHPAIAVLTNIDPEHLDHYGSVEAVKDAFVVFANQVPFYGLVVACIDHPNIQDILPRIDRRVVTYGFAAHADYRAKNARVEGLSVSFEVLRRGESLGRMCVRMPGMHNVLNALATIAVADELRVDPSITSAALREFSGVQRRFTVVGEHGGVTVVDDYGHHPTEIEVTLEAAQQAYEGRVVVAFQPHRFTRTRDCFDDLVRAFNRADVVFVTDVYSAGEEPIEGFTADRLAEAIRAHGHRDVTYVPARTALVDAIVPRLREGDVVITLGAGDITKTGRELIERLRAEG
ncbi:MAG: UDP-N-acetylmuramate--L-alanine ligase [Myxococcales bacterium]|nr:UDP-N-acetylmuramate--L-alanine ligase [Myxococcales bacterium]